MAKDFSNMIQFSECRCTTDPPDAVETRWRSFAFWPAEDLMVTVANPSAGTWFLCVWALSHQTARQQLEKLRIKYTRKPKRVRGRSNFVVLSTRQGFLYARHVGTTSLVKTDDDLTLNYGSEFTEWNAAFLLRLRKKNTGITILRGEPGTGKTTYLRYLTHKLRRSHRVYYLPMSVYPLLASPASVDFWMCESEEFAKLRKIVILEDAESLLMQRAADNREDLSNLLNLADGFLGELLRMQVICTMNCPVEKIDPAIVRPGRLIAMREFVRLSAMHARILATVKNLTINSHDSYSLAELYNPPSETTEGEKILGFTR